MKLIDFVKSNDCENIFVENEFEWENLFDAKNFIDELNEFDFKNMIVDWNAWEIENSLENVKSIEGRRTNGIPQNCKIQGSRVSTTLDKLRKSPNLLRQTDISRNRNAIYLFNIIFAIIALLYCDLAANHWFYDSNELPLVICTNIGLFIDSFSIRI